MARHRQFAAAAEGKAVDRGDHRLAQLLDFAEHTRSRACKLLAAAGIEGGKLGDVGPGNERLAAGAGEDHAADRVVVRDVLHGLGQVR